MDKGIHCLGNQVLNLRPAIPRTDTNAFRMQECWDIDYLQELKERNEDRMNMERAIIQYMAQVEAPHRGQG